MNTIRSMRDLERFRGKNRVLLIFAPSAMTGQASTQEELLATDLQALAERDVEVVILDQSGDVDELLDEFEIAEGSFVVLLLGKDGTVKMRSADPITPEQLRTTIDAMPMRQQEMDQ